MGRLATTMATTAAAADEALEETLKESAPDETVTQPADENTEASVAGTVVDTHEQPGEIACTAEEAAELVEKARKSIRAMDEAMTEILRRRAWEPLGYDDPITFWKKEFAPAKGLSRNHVYRTARVLAVLYGLSARIGDSALTIDITERHLRELALAQHESFMDAVEEEVNGLPEGERSEDDLQRVFDEQLKERIDRARQEAAGDGESDLAHDDTDARLEALGIDRTALRADSVPNADEHGDEAGADETGGAFEQGGGGSRDGESSGADLSSMSRAGQYSDADLAGSTAAYRLQNQFAALTQIEPEVIDQALQSLSHDDVERLAAQASRVVEVAETITGYWDEVNDDDEGPLEL